jgi:thiamine-monophosphate kinase
MGGKPTYALVSLGLPADLPLESFHLLFKGMRDEMSAFGAYIIGGNLARTKEELVVDVTLVGEVEASRVLTRSKAKPGDRIFVTGTLGASGAGMEALRAYGKKVPKKYAELVKRHVLPVPRVEMGQRIGKSGIASGMIDLSDGVAGDLYHICEKSGVGAEIHEACLPLPKYIDEIAKKCGRSVRDIALHNGEDYELLFTVPPNVPEQKIRALPGKTGVLVTEIGRIVEKRAGYRLVDAQGNKTPLRPAGWDHFRKG